ncbi:hypothetical protein [Noviherbaspirillum sp.]|uniref:hypothetical protein n=1 Tax=Noviherbaspirillum sp. TaxID=1926288 RepID=UPI002D516954|nr:hypothetical protein [Noviherbaspirillum sp.]HZW23482.1 hypothetical protein [Noviherbaspirillum sp.]
MKRFFIGLLLAIFSVQGAIAAVGDDALLQDCSCLQWAGSNSIDSESPEVFPVIEELSDYVILGLPPPIVRHELVVPSILPVHLLSPDLPKIKPPPRT